MLNTDTLNETLADAVMDRPREFFIDGERFCLWSPSLGMSILSGRHIENLSIDYHLLSQSPSMEALRLATEKREEVCLILALHSFRDYESLSEWKIIADRAELYLSRLSIEETAKLFLLILSEPKIDALFKLSGISDDQIEQRRISEHKNKDGHSRSFGGKTIFGTLLDTACKTYGWTKQYVVWGIDLISLRMMIGDALSSVYLSDEELKSLGIITARTETFGMSDDDFAKLREMDWT